MRQRPAWVDLYWLPLGAGAASHCVRWNGEIYEAIVASVEQRRTRDLYHSALEVGLAGDRFVIEMTPVWGNERVDRGVVAAGPVGLPGLGRSRLFRYEVRRWRNGRIPDASAAVDSPRRLSSDAVLARRVLDLVPQFPTATWGRDEQRTGDMWNSNSLIAWLLARSHHEIDGIEPPPRGRAPGWRAGLVIAARQMHPGLPSTSPTTTPSSQARAHRRISRNCPTTTSDSSGWSKHGHGVTGVSHDDPRC